MYLLSNTQLAQHSHFQRRLWAVKPSCYCVVCCGFMPSASPLGTSVLGILAQAGSSCSSAAQATTVDLISSKGHLPELYILALQCAC